MKLEDINKMCGDIIHFYNYETGNYKMYSWDTYSKLDKEYNENLFKIKNIINDKIIEKINNTSDNYYNIYNFLIIFKEELISNELLLDLIKKDFSNKFSYFNILMMNKELNNDIIHLILEKIDIENDFTGSMPFDYRYHILRRNEISDNIKTDILNTYDEYDLKYMIEKLKIDILDEFNSQNINEWDLDDINIDEIKKYDNIYNEYTIYKMFNEYLNQKVYKK